MHEVLIMNEPVKRSILNNEAAIDIKRVAMKSGMKNNLMSLGGTDKEPLSNREYGLIGKRLRV